MLPDDDASGIWTQRAGAEVWDWSVQSLGESRSVAHRVSVRRWVREQ
jgi:hypothetical protein